MKHVFSIALVMMFSPGCNQVATAYEPFGEIERLDPALDAIVAPDASLEKLADGFTWSEGPAWLASEEAVIFSDVPEDTVYKWKDGEGLSVYLKPSGLTLDNPRSGEPGSNGLMIDHAGRLILCQHGNRQVAYMYAPLDAPEPHYVTIADRHNGKRFNSPNDLAIHSSGDIYFTDPPYGLPGQYNSDLKETGVFGVYRIKTDESVSLLISDATAPNGIAFSPDEQTLYLAQSDPRHPRIEAYDVNQYGAVGNGRVLFDASELAKTRRGLPDGMAVDQQGNLFATGPGGVLVLSPDGKHLGTLMTGRPTGNCCFGDDGHTLYITADDVLLRVRVKTKGVGF